MTSKALNNVVKLRGIVNVKEFGVVGDGVANDTAAIQAAIASNAKEINFPAGTYNLGTLGTNSVAFAVSNKNGLRFVANGEVTFTCGFSNDGTDPTLFRFENCNDVLFDGNFSFIDLTHVAFAGATGIKAFSLQDNCRDFEFESVSFTGFLTGIETVGTANSRSISRIRANIVAVNVYYPLNCQKNGDDIEATIHGTNCRREYFVYGVRNHRIKLTIVDSNINNTTLISSYENSHKTENIWLDVTGIFSGAPNLSLLTIQHSPATASGVTGGIENITINYAVHAASPNTNTALGAIWLRTVIDGGAEVTSNVNCVTKFVTFTGSTNGLCVYDVLSRYTLTAGLPKGEAFWPVNARFDQQALKVLHHTKTYSWTPAISGTGWALGNGTVEGNYTLLNDADSIFVWGKITWGSTSTFSNSAAVNITLPTIPFRWGANNSNTLEGSFNSGHPSNLTMVGMANLWDSSVGSAGYYDIPVKINGSTGTVFLTFHGNGGFLLGNNPFNWDTGDTIQFFAHVIHNNTTETAP